MTGLNKPADTTIRQEYPAIAAKVGGEDPARWLDRSLVDNESAREVTRTLIETLPDRRHVALWLQVEHDLDRGPRSKVVEWLHDRRDELDVADWHAHLAKLPTADPEPTESVAVWVRETADGGYETYDRNVVPYRSDRPSLEAFKRRHGLDESGDEPAGDGRAIADGGDETR